MVKAAAEGDDEVVVKPWQQPGWQQTTSNNIAIDNAAKQSLFKRSKKTNLLTGQNQELQAKTVDNGADLQVHGYEHVDDNHLDNRGIPTPLTMPTNPYISHLNNYPLEVQNAIRAKMRMAANNDVKRKKKKKAPKKSVVHNKETATTPTKALATPTHSPTTFPEGIKCYEVMKKDYVFIF